MKWKIKIFAGLFLFFCCFSYGQMQDYGYMRTLSETSDQWHKIILPNPIFEKLSSDFSDLRIYGITSKNDTIEAPYLLRLSTEKALKKEVNFNLINTTHNDQGYYFTFEILTDEPINQIQLQFKQQNFDWNIQLEGSQNQQEWFTIINDYRILSIKNNLTDFQFTKITFPNAKYRFFRLRIPTNKKPELTEARVSLEEPVNESFKTFPVKAIQQKENKLNKQTEIDIELERLVPVCQLKIIVKDAFDYYRPVLIQYLRDSVKTDQGWKYNYATLTSGTLNSIEENKFKFPSTLLQHLKIIIRNQDNQPLTLDNFEVTGYIHELVARFTEPARYFLVYGNEKAQKPSYDIKRFNDKIPATLLQLELGAEQTIRKAESSSKGPLFQNKIWLWGIMAVIILLLGWFSIKMIQTK